MADFATRTRSHQGVLARGLRDPDSYRDQPDCPDMSGLPPDVAG